MWPWLTVDQRILRTAKQFAKEDRRLRPFSLASTLENYKKLFGEHVDDCAGHLGWLNCDGPTLEKLIDRSFPASQLFYGIELHKRCEREVWALVNDDGPGGCYKFDHQGRLSSDFLKCRFDPKEQTGSISDDMLTPQKFVLSEDCEFTQYVDRHGHAHPLESARKERKWGNNPFALFHIELPRSVFPADDLVAIAGKRPDLSDDEQIKNLKFNSWWPSGLIATSQVDEMIAITRRMFGKLEVIKHSLVAV